MRKPRGVDPKARPSVWEEDPLGQGPLLQPTGLCSAFQSSITPPPIASLSHLPPSHTHSLTLPATYSHTEHLLNAGAILGLSTHRRIRHSSCSQSSQRME